MHLIGFIVRIYHDARSPECQKSCLSIKCKRVVSNEAKISFVKVRIQSILSSILLYVIINEIKHQTCQASSTVWTPTVCYYVRNSLPLEQILNNWIWSNLKLCPQCRAVLQLHIFSWGFPSYVTISHISHACHTIHRSHSPSVDHPNNIPCTVQIMKPHIIRFVPFCCHFLPPSVQIFPPVPCSQTPSVCLISDTLLWNRHD